MKLLTMDMFRNRTKLGKRLTKFQLFPLAKKLIREEGICEHTKWFETMEKIQPTAVGGITGEFKREKPRKIVYEEDKLIRAYYNRRPLAKLEPIDMHHDDFNIVTTSDGDNNNNNNNNNTTTTIRRHFVRQFALRQLEIMNKLKEPIERTKRYPFGRKNTELEALKIVEKEAEEEQRKMQRTRKDNLNPFIPTLISKIKVDPNLLDDIVKREEIAWEKNKELKKENATMGIVGRFATSSNRRKQNSTTTGTSSFSRSTNGSSKSINVNNSVDV